MDQRPDNKFYVNEVVDSEGNYVRITEETSSDDTKSGVPAKSEITATPDEVSNQRVAQPDQNVNAGLELSSVPVQEHTATVERDFSLPAVPVQWQNAGGQSAEARTLPGPVDQQKRRDQPHDQDEQDLQRDKDHLFCFHGHSFAGRFGAASAGRAPPETAQAL